MTSLTKRKGKSFFDYSDKEKRAILRKAAREGSRMQRDLVEKPSPFPKMEWEKRFGEIIVHIFGTTATEPLQLNEDEERAVKSFIRSAIATAVEEEKKMIQQNIGFLRQWLNEDRITDVNKLVTNEEIKYWLFDSLTPKERRKKI